MLGGGRGSRGTSVPPPLSAGPALLEGFLGVRWVSVGGSIGSGSGASVEGFDVVSAGGGGGGRIMGTLRSLLSVLFY